MATLEERIAQAPDLLQDAWRVAFGHDGAELAASLETLHDGAELSARDRRMLSIGTLAGAAAAVARARFPFESGEIALERADLVLKHARSVKAVDRESRRLFEEGGGS